MRNWGLMLVLLPFACGSSTSSKDSARSEDSTSSDLTTISTINDPCSYVPGRDLPTDVASCIPTQGVGVVYDLNLAVDAGSCESRPTVPCNGVCGAGPTLYTQIMNLVRGCLYGESTFIVSFSQGCADRLYLATPYYDPDKFVACVAGALDTSHFDCAEEVPCWGWSESTLAP